LDSHFNLDCIGQKPSPAELGIHARIKKSAWKEEEEYQHCVGRFSRTGIDTSHVTATRIELMYEIWMLLENLIVLPYKVGTNLANKNQHSSTNQR
jgi:hypothetical protein